MARDKDIDDRLWQWAERLKSGDGTGYPVKSTIHPDWSPPPQGMRPGMKVCTVRPDEGVHAMIDRLPASLKATVVAHYLLKLSAIEAGAAMGCAPATVGERIERAHRMLRQMISEPGVFASSA